MPTDAKGRLMTKRAWEPLVTAGFVEHDGFTRFAITPTGLTVLAKALQMAEPPGSRSPLN